MGESIMLTALGAFTVRRARLVLALSGFVLVAATALGIGAFSALKTAGAFQDPSAPSTKAQQLLDRHFGGANNVVLLVEATHGTVDDAAVAQAATAAANTLRGDAGASNVLSYWQTHNPGLRSTDGRYGLVLANVRGDDGLSDAQLAALRVDTSSVTVRVGGGATIGKDVTAEVGSSLGFAEAIAVPIIMLLLVFAFGSVVAALLPLAIGGIAIMGTFAELFVLGHVTDVAVYAINLTTALGLALAIDYALLMVSRYREELAAGASTEDAVLTTVRTAGRTI